MKTILIALDYGTSAQKIAEKGVELAKGAKANIVLLHVVAEESYYSMIDSAPFISYYGADFFGMADTDNLVDSSLQFLEKIRENLKDTSIRTIALQGDCAEVILETAQKEKAHAIVIGSHSHNWLEKAVMGSVAESVLAGTKIPLYLIPVKGHQ